MNSFDDQKMVFLYSRFTLRMLLKELQHVPEEMSINSSLNIL